MAKNTSRAAAKNVAVIADNAAVQTAALPSIAELHAEFAMAASLHTRVVKDEDLQAEAQIDKTTALSDVFTSLAQVIVAKIDAHKLIVKNQFVRSNVLKYAAAWSRLLSDKANAELFTASGLTASRMLDPAAHLAWYSQDKLMKTIITLVAEMHAAKVNGRSRENLQLSKLYTVLHTAGAMTRKQIVATLDAWWPNYNNSNETQTSSGLTMFKELGWVSVTGVTKIISLTPVADKYAAQFVLERSDSAAVSE